MIAAVFVTMMCLLPTPVVSGSGDETPQIRALQAEVDPARRAEHGLNIAEEQFDSARESYVKGRIHSGDEALDVMTKALDTSVASLEQSRKSRLFKRAEMRVAHLQRRLDGLLEDISIEDRGWAEQTARHLAEIHDKLLAGAMRK